MKKERPALLLQIGRSTISEDDNGEQALFKCLGCGKRERIHLGAAWLYCPHCGAMAGMKVRNIPGKKYYDNFGCWRQINGKWVHDKRPWFTVKGQVRVINDDHTGYGEWEDIDNPFDKKTGDHIDLKHFIQHYRNDKKPDAWFQRRWVLVPSKPLPLP